MSHPQLDSLPSFLGPGGTDNDVEQTTPVANLPKLYVKTTDASGFVGEVRDDSANLNVPGDTFELYLYPHRLRIRTAIL